jgi:glycosyltransferase involved in cell wall biosynthesis
MKILHTVEFYHPRVGGAEAVVKTISEELARRGHDVTVATTFEPARDDAAINGVRVEQFRITGNAARGLQGETNRYVEFVRNHRADIVLNYAAQNWTTDALLPHLPSVPSVKLLAPCGYSGLHRPEFRSYFHSLPSQLKAYDALVYHSANHQDKRFGDEHGLANLAHIIPNGADEEEFSRRPLGFRQRHKINTPFLLLCVANHYQAKGHWLVIEAFRRLRRNDCTLVIIGQPAAPGLDKWRHGCYRRCRIAAWFHPRIRVLENIPRDWVVSAFQEADLFVFGSQVECFPLVILEAMAAQTPFVSTPVGNIPDFAAFGALVETAPQMAQAINKLLEDQSLRETLGRAAQDEWRARYTWKQIVDQYETLYHQLLATRSAR